MPANGHGRLDLFGRHGPRILGRPIKYGASFEPVRGEVAGGYSQFLEQTEGLLKARFVVHPEAEIVSHQVVGRVL